MPPKPDHEKLEKFCNLHPFTGKEPALAPEWLEKFQLMRERRAWEDVDALFYFKNLLTASAYVWLKSLSVEDKGNFSVLESKFKSDWISNEPRIVIERRLEARTLAYDKGETVESYKAGIIELGNKLDRTGDSLCNDFLRGLPAPVKEYCIQSDKHT